MKLSHYDDLNIIAQKHWWHIAKKNLIKQTLIQFYANKNSKILDIGCATGYILKSLKEYKNIHGIDIEKKAIKICHKNGLNNVKLGNSEKIAYKSNFFDYIIACDVLEHVDEQKSLKEIYRVLKPGGILIITVPAYQWLWSKWDEILMHKKRYSTNSLNKALSQNKFYLVKTTYLYSFLVFPVFFIRKIKTKLTKNSYSTDLALSSNSFFNPILMQLSIIERGISKYIDIPFGLSIF